MVSQFLSISFFYLLIVLTAVNAYNYSPNFSICLDNTTEPDFPSYRDELLSKLSISAKQSGGFNTTSVNNGQPNQINGLIMCYNDIIWMDCSECLDFSTHNATLLCPNYSTAIFSYDWCIIHFSRQNFFSRLALEQPSKCLSTSADVSDSTTWNSTVYALLDSLRAKAINSTKLYANGNRFDPGMQIQMYGVVQCTKDLLASDCNLRIQSAIRNMSTCSRNGKASGVRVQHVSCYIRYANYPLPELSEDIHIDRVRGSKNKPKFLPAIIIASAMFLVIVSGLFFARWRKRLNYIKTTPSPDVFPSSDVQVFDLISLRNATNDFSEELGRGGFGKVFKGIIGGKEIAVKKLSEDSKQGSDEFKAEVELLGRLKHNNLVQLLGYCIEGTEKLICYEYLPNGSLDKLLFDRNNVNKLDWDTRRNIILGICCGLRYVQEESINKIVHRDLKAGNILLDKDMIPKIADFGTARLFQDEQTHAITSKAIGTLGYLAPEYFREGKFSFKSDIYSFGIMLLEIVTGQPIIPPKSSDGSLGLVGNVVQNWTEGAADDLKDPDMGEAPEEEIRRYIQIGLCCINDSAENRPPMRQIELMLQGYCPIPDPQIPRVPNGWMPNTPSSATEYNSISSN